jgi:2-polyprenyl-3-methyl-5-hydroxy-6-metoxy-1,4-benzoquinol methylase
MQNKIPLSDPTLDLVRSVYAPVREKYIDHRVTTQQLAWKQSYDVVKDSSWPDCYTYSDFDLLPERIRVECIEQHGFSPEIFKQSIVADADAHFKIDQAFALNPYLVEFLNLRPDVVHDKKIIDIGCNFGYWSMFAYNNHCANVLGVDVRPENISIATLMQQQLAIPDTHMNFVQGDIHQHAQTAQLCADRDTVFLLGVMYHVHDHYDILKSLSQPGVNSLVIMTREADQVIDSDMPLIWWKHEPAFELVAGFHEDRDTVLVGYPNTVWFDLVMAELGFARTASTRYHEFISQQRTHEFKQFTSIFLYERT